MNIKIMLVLLVALLAGCGGGHAVSIKANHFDAQSLSACGGAYWGEKAFEKLSEGMGQQMAVGDGETPGVYGCRSGQHALIKSAINKCIRTGGKTYKVVIINFDEDMAGAPTKVVYRSYADSLDTVVNIFPDWSYRSEMEDACVLDRGMIRKSFPTPGFALKCVTAGGKPIWQYVEKWDTFYLGNLATVQTPYDSLPRYGTIFYRAFAVHK